VLLYTNKWDRGASSERKATVGKREERGVVARNTLEAERKVTELRVGVWPQGVGIVQIVLLYTNKWDRGVSSERKATVGKREERGVVARNTLEAERKVTELRVGVWPQGVGVVQIVLLYTNTQDRGVSSERKATVGKREERGVERETHWRQSGK